MSTIVALEGSKRELVGKGAARSLRRSGLVPAIIYGGGKDEVMLSLPEKELTILYNKHGFMSHLYELKVEKKSFKALVKNVQLHPVTDKIEHVDFLHVAEGSKIKIMVPLEFVNKESSVGIKRGGVLNVSKHDIEIECSANSIPEHLEVDVNSLDIGQSIHVKDLKLPKGANALLDGEATICAIVGRVEEAETPPAQAVETPAPSSGK